MSLLAVSEHICVRTFVIVSSGEILRSGISGWVEALCFSP